MLVHYNSPGENYLFYLILQLNLLNFLNSLSALKIARLTKHDFLSMFVLIHAL